MSRAADQPNSLPPWLWWWPMMSGHAAPEQVAQSILPWTFAGLVINQQNSSAPATEQAIVAEQGYGRQLGRIAEVLEVLIAERPAEAPTPPALEVFATMQKRISDIKSQALRDRVGQLVDDLKQLREKFPEDYEHVRTALGDLA